MLARVQKANPRETKMLRAIIERIQPIFSANLSDGIKSFKRSINLYDLERLIINRDYAKIKNIIPFDNTLDWKEFSRLYDGAVTNAAVVSHDFFRSAAKRLFPSVSVNDFSFDPSNPRISQFITNQSATMVTGISAETQVGIQTALRDSLNMGLPPRSTARVIRESIGLTENQTNAVANFEGKLQIGRPGMLTPFQRDSVQRTLGWRSFKPDELQGLDQGQIDRLVSGYADHQLDYRVDTIAYNELQNAANFGQRELWDQAADSGLFDSKKTRKQWVVVEDDRLCDICAPMDGAEVDYDEQFIVGGESLDGPQAHVNCRCELVLIFPEERK